MSEIMNYVRTNKKEISGKVLAGCGIAIFAIGCMVMPKPEKEPVEHKTIDPESAEKIADACRDIWAEARDNFHIDFTISAGFKKPE